MRIYSMTATFGKLSHETLTLKPGLNILEAPNEWGKSTWCAFILAMLYGIDTSSRSKKDFIADKERYAPWSGAPMSGRMDLHWEGRDITIERSAKGRSIFGTFKAYETETGIEVPELTAFNCGEKLLGVEQSVFERTGFVKLKDMPVTQDETLRRRLNSLVTTGDESGSADDLAQKLRDLKNRCRFNRSGLLPQAEAEQKELKQKLEELENLRLQVAAVEKRQEELKDYQTQLDNHKRALRYEEDRDFNGKLAIAQAQLEVAQERMATLENACKNLPSPKELDMKKLQLQQLQEKREALQMEIQMQSTAPQMPEVLPQFRGLDPDTVVQQVKEDFKTYESMQKAIKKASPILWILGLIMAIAGGVLLVKMGEWIVLAAGALLTLVGVILQASRSSKNKQLKIQMKILARRYESLAPAAWVAEAERYADNEREYAAAMKAYLGKVLHLEVGLKDILRQQEEITDGMSSVRFNQETEAALQQHLAYADARRECSQLEELVTSLAENHRQVTAPETSDTLTFTEAETDRILSDVAAQIRQLHLRAGQCQGRMEALGDMDVLQMQLEKVTLRIGELEKVYAATVLAQQHLEEAKRELQRRFAPRISRRAQELFSRMTGGRYQRFALDQELGVSTAAEGEDTLHSALWRSDGTMDQLYLALRLAVAEELTPQAPLVLDDAFVRCDDDRLKEILKLLMQSGKEKQVILFTCQSREQKIMEELS